MTWPAVKRSFTQDEFRLYVEGLVWQRWRPSKIVWHNTAKPTLAQWIKSAKEDQAKGIVPGISRINSLENFFRFANGWSGCPHLFNANDVIWVMNPLTSAGVHSPSFNNSAIGIEMIGDYAIEDADSGEGLRVKQNTIFATAILCSALGLDPSSAIYLHKQDPKTTHNCPGKYIADQKFKMIAEVQDLMSGGDHNPTIEDDIPVLLAESLCKTIADKLNFRAGPGVDNESKGMLPLGLILIILNEAGNGTTSWLRVKTPAGYIGWVSGKYVERIRT